MASRGAARPAPRGDAPGAPPARAHRLPRTVVYVDHATGLGGAERSLLELLCAIDRARVKSVLACVEGALAREARQRGEDVRLVPLERLKGATVALQTWFLPVATSLRFELSNGVVATLGS